MHAMPEGGELKFATSNIQIASVDAQVLNIPAGDYVKLTIIDTGIGMTDEIVAHIFEPFYSTKGEKGTGLGLSQVYNFVTEFKGTIRVYSEPGHGSCFSIYLPRHLHEQAGNETDEPATINEDHLYGSASILVVDDEHPNRELAENILSSHGYRVFCASDAKQALTILENDPIDLVLSDVIMPGMNGFELAHIILHIHPDIKIQLCRGIENITSSTVTNNGLSDNLLAKPFTARQLLIKVHELLHS